MTAVPTGAHWQQLAVLQGASLFLLATGCAMAAWGLYELYCARRSLAWPAVRGKVVRSKVTRYISKPTRWDWEVRYRYEVNGSSYEGYRVFFGGTVPISTARAIVSKFALDSTVTVYHHPEKPAKSVLMRGANKFTYLPFLAPLILWLVGLMLWFLH
ncbi:DUF3592 domain-containing protein [Chitinimonas arctica]|uniref:DUF3592 domain-containing protein n=1 Tax=Chitinimonas arctica TaxID=2594795 RepID=A0A516S9Y9_9NEIS|nr:DUF3592 domain-containing protein [Chitinimonas arctica]QDQ24971.1 DUF3592 domain-containing protein [Chitinimonas arctica]